MNSLLIPVTLWPCRPLVPHPPADRRWNWNMLGLHCILTLAMESSLSAVDNAWNIRCSGGRAKEGVSVLNPLFRLSFPGGSLVTVTYTIVDGASVRGVDFSVQTTGTLSLTTDIGESDKTITIPLIDSATPQNDRSFTIVLSNPNGGATMNDLIGTGTWFTQDDDLEPHGRIEVYAWGPCPEANEAAGSLTMRLERADGKAEVVSVRVSTADTTATANTDCSAVDTLVAWTDGDAAIMIVAIQLIDDSIDNDNLYCDMMLSNPADGALLGETYTFVKIVDDNGTAVVMQVATMTVAESAGSFAVLVKCTGGLTKAVSVAVITALKPSAATSGSDLIGISGAQKIAFSMSLN